jgi:aminoglycoside phosphotransferase (APT) family kinase protein
VECTLGPPSGPLVLVHGDLHLRHLLVDRGGRATGVIDWGDTCLAHPAVDLAFAFAAFTGRSRAAMLAAYGPVDDDTELRARVLAVSLCAALADWASSTGDAERLPELLRGLERAVS